MLDAGLNVVGLARRLTENDRSCYVFFPVLKIPLSALIMASSMLITRRCWQVRVYASRHPSGRDVLALKQTALNANQSRLNAR
jgi:hypothetical protein